MRHVIPVNVSQDGGWFGGMLKKRNTIEALIIFLLGLLICITILRPVPLIPKVAIFFIVFMLPAVIALIGINDQSAMEYVMTSMKYRRSRDIIPYLIQTENVTEENLSLSQRIEQTFKSNKESKRQEKQGKKKIKEKGKPKTKQSRKERKQEKKAKKKDLKNKKIAKKKAMKEAKRAIKKGESVNYTPEDFN